MPIQIINYRCLWDTASKRGQVNVQLAGGALPPPLLVDAAGLAAITSLLNGSAPTFVEGNLIFCQTQNGREAFGAAESLRALRAKSPSTAKSKRPKRAAHR
jgi:hypothetical protein